MKVDGISIIINRTLWLYYQNFPNLPEIDYPRILAIFSLSLLYEHHYSSVIYLT